LGDHCSAEKDTNRIGEKGELRRTLEFCVCVQFKKGMRVFGKDEGLEN